MKDFKTRTLPELLQFASGKYTDTPALSFSDGVPLTYSQLAEKAEQIAANLYSLGVKKGDRVAIFSNNMPNWGVVYFGISLTGAIIVPILPDFHAMEVKNILDHSDSRVVFVCDKLYPKVEALNKGGKRIFIRINEFALIPEGTKRENLNSASAEFTMGSTAFTKPEVFEDDTAAIIYTAGTTGHSKGVVLSHKNICSNVVASSTIPNIKEGDHLLSVLPLSHTYEGTIGFLVPIYNGATIFYLSKPPSVSVLLPALKKVRPGIMLSVPLLIEKIVRQSVLPAIEKNKLLRTLYHFNPTHKLIARMAGKKLYRTFGGRLYFFGIGGAALAEDVERFLMDAKFPYAIGYGLTETSPLIAGTNAKRTRFRSTGPVIPGGEIRINNPNPDTGEGEILYRGPNVMKGYYKDPEKTAEVLTEEGWFHTGDLGMVDRNGYLYIKGRVKTMILGASGENIYPEAIESIINNFDFVEDSIVFQEEGGIVALVNLDKEALAESFEHFKDGAKHASEAAAEYSKELIRKVNKQLNPFSRITKLRHEEEPFEKTPKKTIKRYLYTRFKKDDSE